MKCYKTIFPSPLPVSFTDEEIVETVAKRLGSSIADGRYNGVTDGSAGLLSGQYDNDDTLSVDPLCDLDTDPFGMRTSPTPPTSDPSSSPGE